MHGGDPTFVVMAKDPVPGRVKTRLLRDGFFDPEQAAALARSMLRCTLHRLAARGELVLAADPDGRAAQLAAALGVPGIAVCDQGVGDLGCRLDRLWRALAARGRGPVVFFGMDSPDLPNDVIDAVGAGVRAADIVLGPTPDGGFWCFGATGYVPVLAAGIDWGTAAVYDQTLSRVMSAGRTVRELPEWHDIDEPEDVGALRHRLACHRATRSGRGLDPPATRDDAALRILAEDVEALWAQRFGGAGPDLDEAVQ